MVDTGTDGAVAKSSTNGLVGTGFASRHPELVYKGPMGRCKIFKGRFLMGRCKDITPSSLSLTNLLS